MDINHELAEQLRQERFTTKEDLLSWLTKEKERISDQSKTDKNHSAAFYYAYANLIQKFYEAIEKAVLFQKLEDYWFYSLGISYSGANLSLVHVSKCWKNDSGTITLTSDQEFTILNVRGNYLSVEQYASEYGVGTGTVRQWIRRGKIRSAVKVGQTWIIPELTELPARGFQSATYFYNGNLENCPDEFNYLQGYTTVLINQNRDDKTLFDICLAARNVEPYSFSLETKEREKLELFLISNPQVHYVDGPTDGMNIAISTKAYVNDWLF